MSNPMPGRIFLTLSTASASFRAHSRASVCASSAWSSGRLFLKNFRKIVLQSVPSTDHNRLELFYPRNLPAL